MEIVCRRRSNCQKGLWFVKSSSFACLMGYFSESCSGAIKSSVPRCIGLVSVAQTVLVWQIGDLDSEAATRGFSIKKDVLKNFPKFIVKQLCQSLVFNEVVGLSLQLY